MSDVDSDLDDLDDLLPTFQQPAAKATPPAATRPSEPPAAADLADDDDDDDEAAFAAAFEQNMADMLASLAGAGQLGSGGGGGVDGEPPAEGAWERAFEQALADASRNGAAGGSSSSNGAGAGSRSQPPSASSLTATPAGAAPGAGGPAAGKADFKQTVRETVDRLKASSDGAGSTSGADEDPLAALLASLGLDPDSAAGLGGAAGGDGEDDDGVLERMMQGLMSKDVLYEPMCELAEKYPSYLASPAARALDPAQLHAYTAQSALVAEIVAVFRQSSYTEDGPRGEQIRSEVQALMGRMQDLGSPPAEVMGEMPDFELGADGLPKLPAGLDGPDGCVIC